MHATPEVLSRRRSDHSVADVAMLDEARGYVKERPAVSASLPLLSSVSCSRLFRNDVRVIIGRDEQRVLS